MIFAQTIIYHLIFYHLTARTDFLYTALLWHCPITGCEINRLFSPTTSTGCFITQSISESAQRLSHESTSANHLFELSIHERFML